MALFVLTVLGGSICGIIALSAIPSLRRELQQARSEIHELHRELRRIRASETVAPPIEAAAGDQEPAARIEAVADERRERRVAEEAGRISPEPAPASDLPTPVVNQVAENIRANWMIWLGGFCVALAGIFLVRYSIDQGLLGPTGRIVSGLVVGAALHLGAEYLRRRTGGAHPAFAAMAGAGSITLYASLLAGMRLYGLLAPGSAFLLMAAVALATMVMAYFHGPVLAAFGMLGAYLVPILVSTGGGQVVVALIYALIVSASSLLLLRYVYRNWLWWGFVAGAIGWWLVTLNSTGADDFRPYYLTILAYMIVAIPSMDWLLRNGVRLAEENYDPRYLLRVEPVAERQLLITLLLIVLALGLSVLHAAEPDSPWVFLIPGVLFLFLARSRESLFWSPWLYLLVLLGGWLIPRVVETDDGWTIALLEDSAQRGFIVYLLGTAIVTSALALWHYRHLRFRAVWSSLATTGPVLLLTVGYLLTAYPAANWYWGTATALLALAYVGAATRLETKGLYGSLVVWLFISGHLGLALAAAIFLSAATLTLALAAQMISVATIINRFRLPDLAWLMKLVAAAVVVRLTVNPWLLEYPAEIHWPLWTYGGSTLCAIAATRLLRNHPTIARWTEAVALHLFVLTVWAELRYLLYDGMVFAREFTLAEAQINIALFGTLSIVYYRRSLVSSHLARLYVVFSYLLLALSAGTYLYVGLMTAFSNAWVYDAVRSTPILNSLLGAYGVPVLLGLLFARYHEPTHRKYALGFTAVSAFIFISVQIRHLWEGTINYADPPTSPGELYSYSAVWLVLAVLAILGGAWRFGRQIYRAGMLLLAVVIAKLFLVDMSDLEGLLRVASFMGLGLSLLGLSYLYQKLQTDRGERDRRQSPGDV